MVIIGLDIGIRVVAVLLQLVVQLVVLEFFFFVGVVTTMVDPSRKEDDCTKYK
jgi:hypothetical protein